MSHRAVALGIDLAWSSENASGVCALDAKGEVVDERLLGNDEEIISWVEKWAAEVATLAIDAPLLVTNREGRRPCESDLSRVYGSRWASPHSSNRTRLVERHGEIRGEILASRLSSMGFDDPWSGSARTLLEVYPHTGIIEAFGLPRRLAYKKGRIAERAKGLRRLDQLIGLLADADPPLHGNPIDVSYSTSGAELKASEDALDARICAWTAAVCARSGGDRIRLFGDRSTGHIAVPIGPFLYSADLPGWVDELDSGLERGNSIVSMSTRIEQLTEQYRQARAPLEQLGLLERGEFLEAEYGEWIVCELLELDRAQRNEPGHDATGLGGVRYQIKTRKWKGTEYGVSWDFHALNPDGFDVLVCIFIGPGWTVNGILMTERMVVLEHGVANRGGLRFRWNTEADANPHIEKFYWPMS